VAARALQEIPGRVVIAALAGVLLTAACGAAGAPTVGQPAAAPSAGASGAASAAPAATSAGGGRYGTGTGASPRPAHGGVVITVAMTSLGDVLAGPNGLTLYTKSGDSATVSTCTGACATAWPPLTVASGATATAGTGVTGTLGTLTRTDGTIQVTYKGLPLYYWQGDTQAGDTTGQGINGFSVARP